MGGRCLHHAMYAGSPRERVLPCRLQVQLEESYGGLQREYMRVVKVADLARTVSAQSMSSCVKAKSQLKDAQDGMHR